MPYTNVATSKAPALIIYLLDVSASMGEALGTSSRMAVVNDCLDRVLRRMVQRATKGSFVSPRYRISIVAYSDQVFDVLQGIRTCAELAHTGMPQLQATQTTNATAAFMEARRILEAEMPKLPNDAPAPLVCHMTDGEFNEGGDPLPHAQAIMNMRSHDGNVLVENIFVKPNLMSVSTDDPMHWPGCSDPSELTDPYARKLFDMSSPLPDSYHTALSNDGYRLTPGCRMLFPGETRELVALGFAVSGATGLTGEVKAALRQAST